jgi:hypothetical protein
MPVGVVPPRTTEPIESLDRLRGSLGIPTVPARRRFPSAKVLFICGSLNQTTINYKISKEMPDCDCYFTPYYGDGIVNLLASAGLLDFTILGGQARSRTEQFLDEHRCALDLRGTSHDYDLVVTCSDLIVPNNVQGRRIVLVQEGMVDPQNLGAQLVKTLGLPRYLGNTSMAGLSHAYEIFCVASEGFRKLFVQNGVDPRRLVVTGIPNFDNVDQALRNDFPHHGYVLAATSHLRETWKYENRRAFIKRALEIADNRQLIFKLHPNERRDRAVSEIERYAPGSLIFQDGNINHMIANCSSLVTRYSSVMLIALAMGKQVYADIGDELLCELAPVQNGGTSARRIASICRQCLLQTA